MTDLVDKPPTLSELNPAYMVGTIAYASRLEEDLYINRSDLNSEFVKHPERFAFYATCFELASIKVQQYETTLKRLYALLDQEKRQAMADSGLKTTEKMIENMVVTDDRYTALEDEMMDVQKHASTLKVAMIAMTQRKDMLIQLGSAFRAEMQADMSVKAAAAREAHSR